MRLCLLILPAAGLALAAHVCLAQSPLGKSRFPSEGSPGGGVPSEVGALAGMLERKLVHADAVLGEFEKGQARVKVIVNLIEATTSLEEPAEARGERDEAGGSGVEAAEGSGETSSGTANLPIDPPVRAAADSGVPGVPRATARPSLAEAVRRYQERLSRRHAEVQAIQTPVLAVLPEREFTLRHRFHTWASFAGEVTLEGLGRLAADPLVESIEFDYPMKRLTRQGIGLINGSQIRSTYNGQGVAIAIIDDGIDYRHPMLGGGGFPNSKVIGGYDIADRDTNPGPDLNLADNAHGTNCAGIAAGDVGTTGDYIGGVAPGAKLYAVKVFSKRWGTVYNSDLIAAWDWCIRHKLDNPAYPLLVISVSLGQDPAVVSSSNYTASVRKATDVVRAGITLVAAAGNSGWCNALDWPASLRDVISVGAVYDAPLGTISWMVDRASCAPKSGSDRNGWSAVEVTARDKVAVYSNVATTLDLFAPGNQAHTTDVVGPPGVPGDYEPDFGGTSASCPYAAGAVACLQSAAQSALGRHLSPSLVRDILARTGDLVTDTKTPITKPRVNLGRAIQEVLSGRATRIVPTYRFWSPTLSRHFYTIDEPERNNVLDNYAHIWTYEGVVSHSLSDAGEPGAVPVYRFWSPTLKAHFYTIDASERDKLLTDYPHVWSYEGLAFHAFPEGRQPAGASAIYRFWSGALSTHFYTISPAERDKLINQYPHVWTYEGIAWYAYKLY